MKSKVFKFMEKGTTEEELRKLASEIKAYIDEHGPLSYLIDWTSDYPLHSRLIIERLGDGFEVYYV